MSLLTAPKSERLSLVERGFGGNMVPVHPVFEGKRSHIWALEVGMMKLRGDGRQKTDLKNLSRKYGKRREREYACVCVNVYVGVE